MPSTDAVVRPLRLCHSLARVYVLYPLHRQNARQNLQPCLRVYVVQSLALQPHVKPILVHSLNILICIRILDILALIILSILSQILLQSRTTATVNAATSATTQRQAYYPSLVYRNLFRALKIHLVLQVVRQIDSAVIQTGTLVLVIVIIRVILCFLLVLGVLGILVG